MDLDIEALRLRQGRANFCSTIVLAWGSGDLGQLGLGDDRGRNYPTPIRSLLDKDIVHIAANDLHTAFLTGEGELYMTGNNDSGQLGARVRESQLSPVQISALDTYRISHVACGQAHTIAITDVGALVSWGAADLGQLGYGDAIGIVDVIQPRIVKGTRDFHFVRVACGAAHSLALTGSGEVYSFGQGTFGALGSGNREISSTPIHIDELWGLGIIQIACGENHSAALSVDGQVFTWGRGKYGQLGHGCVENEFKPVQVKGLADQMIVQVICGGDHTMAINNEGKLFAWGRGQWGQTGLGTTEDMLVPTQVKVLEHLRVIQGSAGTRHSIAITEEGNVYGWGDGEQNQLGKTIGKVQLEPVLMSYMQREGWQLLYAVAAGEHTMAVYHPSGVDSLPSVDLRCSELISTKYKQEDGKKNTPNRNSVDGILSSENVNFQVTSIAGPLNVNMEEHIEITEPMKLPEGSCIVDVHGNGLKPIRLPILLKMLEGVVDSPRNMAIFVHAMEDIFSSVRFLTLSFKFQPSRWHGYEVWNNNSSKDSTELDGPGLDVLLIRDVYHRILQLYNPEILQKLCKSIMHLLSGIEKHISSVPDSRWKRVLLITLQSPLIGEQGLGDKVSTQLFSLFDSIPSSVKSNMVQWLRTYPKDIFGGRFVRGIQKYISNRKDALDVREEIPRDIASAVKVLSILNEANNLENLIPFKEFYNHAVCDNTSLKIWQGEFRKWVTNEKETKLISLCQVPFLLSPKAKSQILKVRRSDLIADTLRQLSSLPKNEYKKPLKVIFEGEEGVDEGGVTKEFFQILVRDLFHVDYGMFTYYEDTRNFWFNPNSMESDHEFWLIGAILGLAIYNGVILDVHFPTVIYKKLMELTPCVDDIKDFQPEVARSLQQLLEFEGDVASTFCLFFQVSYDYFGELRTYDLLPDGGDIPVTNENRQRYVDLYVRYLLCDSIQSQFNAFSNAFQQVCGGQALKLFRYEELELLICGLPHFDFHALERVAIYDGGYSKESQVIRWFWELVKEMSFDEKKSLLFFTTGNDRAPIGGLGSLRFIVAQNGDDTDRLPTAHTCFNILLIPEYSSKSKLENRLKLAISNSIGFGLQ
ncbi:uncharacterized protein LOC131066540 isoform X2 [Cryptomeria japonica]|uniref:uncharacterized protein LOC131066540 isoform X2 n=1 Tax=Cryptomeria japonica TaxID=3369 RepID=UPI0025ACBC1C|nr:uncharacterized protein LOC131066540 isoform X2 [Cryptomeria japonica]